MGKTTQQIDSVGAMYEFGGNLAQTGNCFLLYGPLGSGKTTITKGIAQQLGIDPMEVKSPSYTYVQVYANKLLHIDMRRITNSSYLFENGIIDLMQSYPYCVIEWPKRESLYADATRITVQIALREQSRVCTVGNRSHSDHDEL